jgi:UPF0716 protein FxsA
MALLFLLVLIGTPVLEIAVFIEVGDRIGLWPTLAGILATAVIGMAVIRVQGLAVLARAQENLRAERFPALEIFDGVCLLLAGAMLITPGFVTDSFGFLLLIVPLRRVAGRLAWRYAEARGFTVAAASGAGASGGGPAADTTIIDVDYEDVTGTPGAQPDDKAAKKRIEDQTVVRTDDP